VAGEDGQPLWDLLAGRGGDKEAMLVVREQFLQVV